MSKQPIITLGSDPEFFLFAGGGPCTAQLLKIEGDKDHPLPLRPPIRKDPFKDYMYHRDNTMLEISTPIAKNVIEWFTYQTTGLEFARAVASKHDAQILNRVDTVDWHPAMLKNSGPSAFEIGCSQDQDAYMAGAYREAGDIAKMLGNIRTAGGHVHIGTKAPFNCPPFIVAMLMDWATLPGRVRAEKNGHGIAQVQRARGSEPYWYRRLGLYREKPYGIEYRTLSNLWIQSNIATKLVGQAAFAVGHFCATQPAKKIRNLVDSINWAAVHRCTDWNFVSSITDSRNEPPPEFMATLEQSELARIWAADVSGEVYGTI